MVIEITEQAGHVSAMGHRVALEQGGHAELKRRCFEQLSHLKLPPDEVRFTSEAALPQTEAITERQAPGSARPALVPPPPDPGALPSTPPEPALARPPTDPATPRAKRRTGR